MEPVRFHWIVDTEFHPPFERTAGSIKRQTLGWLVYVYKISSHHVNKRSDFSGLWIVDCDLVVLLMDFVCHHLHESSTI